MRLFLGTFLALMVAVAPAGADPVRFHNPVLRLSATYDDTRWHVVKSADRNTVFGIIWKNKHGADAGWPGPDRRCASSVGCVCSELT